MRTRRQLICCQISKKDILIKIPIFIIIHFIKFSSKIKESSNRHNINNNKASNTKYGIWNRTSIRIKRISNVIKLNTCRPNKYNILILPNLIPKIKPSFS